MALTVTARTATARIERDDAWAPGRYRAVLALDDQHYRDDQGAWQPVDETLQADGADGFSARADTARHRLRVMDDGTRRLYPRRNVPGEYLELGRPQFWTGSAWQNLTLGSPTRTGNSMVWDRPAFTLTIWYTWRQVKLAIVLKTSNAARRFRWPVSLTGLTRTGSSLFGQDGGRVLRVDRPAAVDATGADVPLTLTIAGGFVEFDADLTGATFPITLDPTLTSQPDATDGVDTWVQENAADTPHDTALTLDNRPNAGSRMFALFRFDTSSIPAGATVDSGTLSLWNGRSTVGFDFAVARILAADSGWVEGATWNYANPTTVRWAGDTGSNGGADAGCSVSGTDYSSTDLGTHAGEQSAQDTEHLFTLDPAELAAMLAANHGVHVRVTGGSGTTGGWRSSDETTATKRPKLVIEYTTGGGAVSAAVTAVAAVLTLTAPAPTVQAQQQAAVTAPAATATLTAPAPTVLAVRQAAISAPAASLTLAAPAPTVATGQVASITAPAASATLTAPPPTVTAQQQAAVAAVPGTLTLTAAPPTVVAVSSAAIAAVAGVLTLTAGVPTVQIGAAQAPGAVTGGASALDGVTGGASAQDAVLAGVSS